MPRIVTVFGATGNQGSSVLNALLADGTFKPRAITRNPNSDEAKKLKERGAEVVQADHSSDVETLKAALSGSEAVFLVTVPGVEKNETEQGKAIIDASKAVGVKFFVWSSLHAPLEGFNVPHMSQKALVDEYLEASKLPHAIIYTGSFIENLWRYGSLRKDGSGGYTLSVPKWEASTPMFFSWIQRDLGPSVLGVLKAYEQSGKDVSGKKFYLGSDQLKYPELTDIISKGLGKPVTYNSIPTSGNDALDQMYAMIVKQGGLYPGVAVPSKELQALGVEFKPFKDSLAEELKARGF